jgi:hypothetical protein
MRVCAGCGGELEAAYRFCPWCAAPQRRKLVEFFRAHPRDAGKALRVSRYLTEDPHVRFSVWSPDGVAEAVVSLEEEEADRLCRLPRRPAGEPPEPGGAHACLPRPKLAAAARAAAALRLRGAVERLELVQAAACSLGDAGQWRVGDLHR